MLERTRVKVCRHKTTLSFQKETVMKALWARFQWLISMKRSISFVVIKLAFIFKANVQGHDDNNKKIIL